MTRTAGWLRFTVWKYATRSPYNENASLMERPLRTLLSIHVFNRRLVTSECAFSTVLVSEYVGSRFNDL